MRLRFDIALVLLIVCLTSSACADIKPALDTSENNHAEHEATAIEIRKLAEEGNRTAQNGLGLLYMAGAGVPQNYGQAKKWFEEAAKQGHAEAQVNLGTLYLRGKGAPQSAQMALFWFSRAAEQGDAPAFAKLGLMYAEAQGVPQDFIQAHMWYHLAAATGDENSAARRDILAMTMTSAQIIEAQKRAREWKPTNKSAAWKLRTLSDPLLEAGRRNITDASPP
jgi:TPR repeat protein